VDFFDDEVTGQDRPPEPAPRRPRRSTRRRTRLLRILVLAAILFLVVFLVAWWARSCQQYRKVDSYRTYFEGVGTAIDDSAAIGRKVSRFVANPTRLSRQELLTELDRWAAAQDEIAVRVGRLEAPGPLGGQQGEFATGMRVRADGYALLEEVVTASLGKKQVDPDKLAALEGYFSGPDAYYMALVYVQSRRIMSDEGVSDVAVPRATYYLNWKALDRARLESALSRVGDSQKLAGIHGVALGGVEARSDTETVTLVKGGTVDVPASAALVFVVKVQNQGDVTESDVPVTATLVLPDKSTLKQEASIATIAAGQTQSVTIEGFAIPTDALSKVSTLRVVVGPVPEERVSSNNRGEYKFLLQLK
jgi:hypothetical protein